LSAALEELQDIIETVYEHHFPRLDRTHWIGKVADEIATALSVRKGATALPTDVKDDVPETELLPNDLTQAVAQKFPQPLPSKVVGDFVDQIYTKVFQSYPSIGERVSAKESFVAKQLMANQYVGIGVQASIDPKSQLTVLNKVFDGGTASQAGLRDGDQVQLVDGNSTFQRPLQEVIPWLRGPAGSEVELEIIREGIPETKRYIVPRRIIPLATLELTAQTQDDSVAVIKFLRIASSSTQELRRLEMSLPSQVRTILLDFRDVQEDGLHVVHLLLDALLDEGLVGFAESTRGKHAIECESGRLFENRTVAAVVSSHTASATQWAATRLKDNGFLVILNISGTSTLLRFPNADESLPSPCEWTQAVVTDLVPIKNDRGSLRMITGHLIDRDGRPSMTALSRGIPQQGSSDAPELATIEQLLEGIRRLQRSEPTR
jgi:carboxyl-terminal processing protease